MVLRICKFCSLPSMVAHSTAGHKTNATRDRRQSLESSPRRASVSHTDDGFTHSDRRRSTHVTLIPMYLPTSPSDTKTTSDPVFPPRSQTAPNSTGQHRAAPNLCALDVGTSQLSYISTGQAVLSHPTPTGLHAMRSAPHTTAVISGATSGVV